MGRQEPGTLWEPRQFEQSGVQPLLVRLFTDQLTLDLLIGDPPALCGVDQEHLARLETAFGDDVVGGDVEYARFGGQDHPSVAGLPPAPGP